MNNKLAKVRRDRLKKEHIIFITSPESALRVAGQFSARWLKV